MKACLPNVAPVSIAMDTDSHCSNTIEGPCHSPMPEPSPLPSPSVTAVIFSKHKQAWECIGCTTFIRTFVRRGSFDPVGPASRSFSACGFKCASVCAASRAFDGAAGACLMWLLAGVGWARGGAGSVRASCARTVYPAVAQGSPLKISKGPKESPHWCPLRIPMFSVGMTSSSTQRGLELRLICV